MPKSDSRRRKSKRDDKKKDKPTNKRQTRQQTQELIRAFERLDSKSVHNLIMDKGVDPSMISAECLARTLRNAVLMQNADLVRELLKHRPQLQTPDEEPLLAVAIRQPNVNIALMLINAGVDVNESQFLYSIICSRNPGLYVLAAPLMDHGADLDVYIHDRSLLYYAVTFQAIPIMEELLRRGARVDEDNRNDIPIFSSTVRNPKAADMLNLMYRYNLFGVERRNRLAQAAIFYYIEQDSADYEAEIKSLIDAGVPINFSDLLGITMLHYAVGRRKMSLIKLFLRYGANVNQASINGVTPIMLAVGFRLSNAIAALLIRHGANIHVCNSTHRYPLHIACENVAVHKIRLLLYMGADVNVRDQWGATPFALLLRRNTSGEAVEILIKYFALLSAKGIVFSGTDLAAIIGDNNLIRIYNRCVNELERMKTTIFTHGITYYNLVSCNIEKLSGLTTNFKFVKQFYKDQSNINGKSFVWPMYSNDLTIAFQMAEKRRDILLPVESMVEYTFDNAFPHMVVQKIAKYLLITDLKYLKSFFYLSLFLRGDDDT